VALRHLCSIISLALLSTALAVTAGTGTSLAAPAAPVASSPGQFGIQLLQVPASAASDPRARIYIIDRLAPGTVIHRQFAVVNLSEAPMTLSVYTAAASISQGTFQFAPGHTQDTMTTWVTVSHPTVGLAAHARATLVATVTVPRDAPPGEQYGVIWAEHDTKGSGNVALVSRVGIRLYLSIGPGGAPASNFTLGVPTARRAANGSPVVSLPIDNTGGRALDLHGTLALTGGPGGLQDGPFPAATVVTTAPGQGYHETFMLSRALPSGPWQGKFTVVSGLLTKTETVTLSFNGSFNGTAAATAASSSFPVVPVAAGGAAAFVIIVVIVVIVPIVGRRRRPLREAGPDHASRPPSMMP
jgi:hypothetical protein